MKKINVIIFSLLSIICLSSCDGSAIDDLTGEYQVAEQLKGETVVNSGREFKEGFNVFTVSNDKVDLQFASKNWFLDAGSYTLSEKMAGNVLLATSTVYGKSIKNGGLTIYRDEDNNYEISGTLFLTDESIVQLRVFGTLVYEEPDIITNYLYKLSDYNDNNVKVGTNMEISAIDGTKVANLLVATTGSLVQDYTIVEDIKSAPNGVASIGADIGAILGLPAGILVFGTYFVENGQMYLVTSGTISITEYYGLYNITISNMKAENCSDHSPYSSDTFTLEHVGIVDAN